MKIRFIGLNLAWSPRNNTAAVALEADGRHARRIDHCERPGSDKEDTAS